MTAEEQWNGPTQDAIREHDKTLGHLPEALAVGPVSPVFYFHPPSRPNGGTVYVRPETPGETQ